MFFDGNDGSARTFMKFSMETPMLITCGAHRWTLMFTGHTMGVVSTGAWYIVSHDCGQQVHKRSI